MVNVFIYFFDELTDYLKGMRNQNIEDYCILEKNWMTPSFSGKLSKEKLIKKIRRSIIEKGKELSRENQSLNDIFAVITSSDFSRVKSDKGEYYNFVDFYESNLRHLNPEL